MNLRLANISVGITQLIINALTAIPLTVTIITSDGGGFGFGYIFLPATIPLAACGLFGLIGFYNYENHYQAFRKVIIGIHLIVAIVGTLTFIIMPIFPFPFFAIPLVIFLIAYMNRNNVGRLILATNVLVLVCLILIGYLKITS